MARHTLEYHLVKKQVKITTIQQISGHESLVTTNLYTRTPEKDMVDALGRFRVVICHSFAYSNGRGISMWGKMGGI